jgi:hypothetical protein
MLAPVAAARFFGRSHLSPDGGGVTRAAVHRLAADGYDSAAGACRFLGCSKQVSRSVPGIRGSGAGC